MKNPARLALFLLALASAAFAAHGASVGFAYARPFRTGLDVDREITDILSQDQQPLVGEWWGVQTKLKFDKHDSGIDTNRGFRVYFRYCKGDSPWGFDRWADASGASAWAQLVQVGEFGDYVFRSTATDFATIVPPTAEANTAVQYMVRVEYFLKGVAEAQSALIGPGVEGDGWTNPAWYEPIDYNTDPLHGNGEHFSPYTILDGVSPGRVWINEVNYCDGPKAQTGGVKCVTNQFVELAVPLGVDLAGWRVVLTDMNHKSLTIAELGTNGVPSSKTSANRSGDYDFLVLQSPDTRDAGGIKDSVTGEPAADGTWVSETLSSTFKAGQLQYDEPYQFELYRPSGIREHQFVVAGTNEWRTPPAYYEAFGYQYDGTNLVQELNAADPSASRFYAGEDLARKPGNEAVWSSLGVTGGAHGEDGGWTSEMKFTPGRVNEGQDELVDWYVQPMALEPTVSISVGDLATDTVTADADYVTAKKQLVIKMVPACDYPVTVRLNASVSGDDTLTSLDAIYDANIIRIADGSYGGDPLDQKTIDIEIPAAKTVVHKNVYILGGTSTTGDKGITFSTDKISGPDNVTTKGSCTLKINRSTPTIIDIAPALSTNDPPSTITVVSGASQTFSLQLADSYRDLNDTTGYTFKWACDTEDVDPATGITMNDDGLFEASAEFNAMTDGTKLTLCVENPDGTASAKVEYILVVLPVPPFVSNVVARQRWPWNGLVDVDYEIGGYTAGLKVEISFDEQGVQDGRHWAATNFLAGAAPTFKAGHNRATWDAKAAGATNVVTEVKATVKLVREE